jgi:hypothetical protein
MMNNKMTSTLHRKLQDELVELGSRLGFLAEEECSLQHLYPGYSPRVDVVWFYPLSKDQSSAIQMVYDSWPYSSESKLLYPYAAFEITSLDATSKTVMSEIWNLKLAGFRYSFNIVPSKNPEHPDYMHKERAERIANTLKYFSGFDDAFVVPIEKLEQTISSIDSWTLHSGQRVSFKNPMKNVQNDIIKGLRELGKRCGFISLSEYTPIWIKKVEKRVTPIRYDVAWLLELPVNIGLQFNQFLEYLGIKQIKDTNPVEVLVFEVESRNHLNKHSVGSILNITTIIGRGVIVMKDKTPDLVRTVKLMSSNKVEIKKVDELRLYY